MHRSGKLTVQKHLVIGLLALLLCPLLTPYSDITTPTATGCCCAQTTASCDCAGSCDASEPTNPAHELSYQNPSCGIDTSAAKTILQDGNRYTLSAPPSPPHPQSSHTETRPERPASTHWTNTRLEKPPQYS